MVCTVLAEDRLDEKTREKMVASMEEAMLSFGEPTYEGGMKKAVRFLDYVTERVHSIQTPDDL